MLEREREREVLCSIFVFLNDILGFFSDFRDTVYSDICGFPLDLFKMTTTGFNGRVLIADDTNQKYIEVNKYCKYLAYYSFVYDN